MKKFTNGLILGLWIAIIIMLAVLLNPEPMKPQSEKRCIICDSIDDGWPVLKPKVNSRPSIKNVVKF